MTKMVVEKRASCHHTGHFHAPKAKCSSITQSGSVPFRGLSPGQDDQNRRSPVCWVLVSCTKANKEEAARKSQVGSGMSGVLGHQPWIPGQSGLGKPSEAFAFFPYTIYSGSSCGCLTPSVDQSGPAPTTAFWVSGLGHGKAVLD